MTIMHETKYKKEDGTEVEIVPLKDIVVTAPGYSTYGWNGQNHLIRDNEVRQSNTLYDTRNAVYPKEADYCETIDFHTSSEGGRARFRIYIEKAKIPQLEEKIRKEMSILKTPLAFFSKKGKVTFSSGFKGCYKHYAELAVKNAKGYLIKDELENANLYGKTIFFFPSYKNSDGERVEILKIDYKLWERKVVLSNYVFTYLSEVFDNFSCEDFGLLDKLRVKNLRKIISTSKNNGDK